MGRKSRSRRDEVMALWALRSEAKRRGVRRRRADGRRLGSGSWRRGRPGCWRGSRGRVSGEDEEREEFQVEAASRWRAAGNLEAEKSEVL